MNELEKLMFKACKNGDIRLCIDCLDKGVDISIVDHNNWTLFRHAYENCNQSIYYLLRQELLKDKYKNYVLIPADLKVRKSFTKDQYVPTIYGNARLVKIQPIRRSLRVICYGFYLKLKNLLTKKSKIEEIKEIEDEDKS
jgi:ankyrin repeat protein